VTAQPCFWPYDPADARVCDLDSGGYRCSGSGRWCGSEYDSYGNKRFRPGAVGRFAEFIPERFFGYAGFDNIGLSFITIFQCITMEGWSDVTYMVRALLHNWWCCRCFSPFPAVLPSRATR
jgi:voltage-dependent calcium channel L type alpha-1D